MDKNYDINEAPCVRNGYISLYSCQYCECRYHCDYFDEYSGYLYDGYDCD